MGKDSKSLDFDPEFFDRSSDEPKAIQLARILADFRMDRKRIVRLLREVRGWNQTQLAKALGVQATAINRWESDQSTEAPNVDNLFRIAFALDYTLNLSFAPRGKRSPAPRITVRRVYSQLKSTSTKDVKLMQPILQFNKPPDDLRDVILKIWAPIAPRSKSRGRSVWTADKPPTQIAIAQNKNPKLTGIIYY